jgi:hypothetical protein
MLVAIGIGKSWLLMMGDKQSCAKKDDDKLWQVLGERKKFYSF